MFAMNGVHRFESVFLSLCVSPMCPALHCAGGCSVTLKLWLRICALSDVITECPSARKVTCLISRVSVFQCVPSFIARMCPYFLNDSMFVIECPECIHVFYESTV